MHIASGLARSTYTFLFALFLNTVSLKISFGSSINGYLSAWAVLIVLSFLVKNKCIYNFLNFTQGHFFHCF